MTYAVHHVDAEGCGQLEDTGSLEEALARVEELRNDGAVSEVRVLKEVPIEVRTYYRVVAVEEGPEVGAAAPAPVTPPAAAVPPPADAPFADAPTGEVHAEVVPGDAAAPVAAPAAERPAPVFGDPPSGAVVMGPPPAAAAPDTPEAADDPAPEPRRALFGRS